MPHYPVKHKETGEEQELWMTMQEYDAWKKDNPDWEKDWSKGAAGSGNVGDAWDKIYKTHPGWKEVMQGVKNAAPTNSSITQKY